MPGMTVGVWQSEPALVDDEPTPISRMLGAHQCPTELGIPAATVRSWAARGRLYSRALDAAGRPLYFEHQLVALRDTRRVAVAKRVATMQHQLSSTRVSTDRVLSHVWGTEVVRVAEQPPEIVIPVRLDLDAAKQQLDQFCDHVRASLGAAVASGLAVQTVTVGLNGLADVERPS
jgi:hypothetical protein